MHQINLLPPSERPPEPTAPKLIITLYVGIAIAFPLAIWVGQILLMQKPDLKERITHIKAEIETLRPEAEYHDRLVAESRVIAQKAEMVDTLSARRVTWAPRFDALWDAVDASRTTWLAGLSLEDVEVENTDANATRRGRRAAATKEMRPTLNLRLRSSSFDADPAVLEMQAETLARDTIDHFRSYEDLVRDMTILPATSWRVSQRDWRRTRRLTVDFEVSLQGGAFHTKAKASKRRRQP